MVVADEYPRKKTGPFIPRTESQKILTSEEMGSKIQNMMVTEEGTLRSVPGPAPYVPDYGAGYPSYGTAHGIYHSIMAKSGRDLLLLHTDDQIWVHQGWNIDLTNANATWEVILGPSSSNPLRIDSIPNPTTTDFPTQFESTPGGVVIVPQGGRAFFYDGLAVLPLGYDHSPSAPTGHGPQGDFGLRYSTVNRKSEDHPLINDGSLNAWTDLRANNLGYSVDGSSSWPVGNGMHSNFGFCEIGTLSINPGVFAASHVATLLPGRWQCKAQWIDRWGNLSPLSPVSNTVSVEQERSDFGSAWDLNGTESEKIVDPMNSGFRSARLLKQFLWASINPGPEGTIGRILFRTKDLTNSGSTDMYELTSDKIGSFSGFSTIPDNTSVFFADNVGDSNLITPATDVMPVPLFRLCKVAFGRLWIANLSEEPGVITPSLPGRWGTFEKGRKITPDPTGAEITGLLSVYGGLMVFSLRSTFIIEPSKTVRDGERQGFTVSTLSSTVGCAGPSTIQVMADGAVVWLGHDGFYKLIKDSKLGFQVSKISDEIERSIRNLNKTRFRAANAVIDSSSGEYRCWVSDQSATTNNLCLVYDGTGWRRRTDVQSRASCTTKDHREYTLVAGTSLTEGTAANPIFDTAQPSLNGVWVLDHEVQSFVPSARDYVVDTSWLSGVRSLEKKTAFTVYIWMREMNSSSLNVEVFRDWRMTAVHTETINLYSTEDPPDFWDTATLDGTAKYNLRRPYWVKADLFLPACESYKLRLTSQTPFEFVGISVAEGKPNGGGMRVPK